MSLGSGRTRVSDLSFQIFGRTVHPEYFQVHAFHRLVQTGWEADLRVVEGGHVLCWRSGSARITEVLVGPDVEWPEPGPLFRAGLRQERSTSLRPEPGVEYQACFAVERMDPEVFAHLSQELTLEAPREAILHRQKAANRLEPSPLSRIRFEATARSLLVHVYHTRPEERAIIRTQSLFEVRRGPRG